MSWLQLAKPGLTLASLVGLGRSVEKLLWLMSFYNNKTQSDFHESSKPWHSSCDTKL